MNDESNQILRLGCNKVMKILYLPCFFYINVSPQDQTRLSDNGFKVLSRKTIGQQHVEQPFQLFLSLPLLLSLVLHGRIAVEAPRISVRDSVQRDRVTMLIWLHLSAMIPCSFVVPYLFLNVSLLQSIISSFVDTVVHPAQRQIII